MGDAGHTPDAFERLLGQTRGSTRPEDDGDVVYVLSATGRARRFLHWAKSNHFEEGEDYDEAEREVAEELRLVLVRGRWNGERRIDLGPHPQSFALIAVYHDDVLVGFWDMDMDRLLLYDSSSTERAQ